MPKHTISITTTFDPVTFAALGYLSSREDPGQCRVNVLLQRLVREELERVRPGAWDRMRREDIDGLRTTPDPKASSAEYRALIEAEVTQ